MYEALLIQIGPAAGKKVHDLAATFNRHIDALEQREANRLASRDKAMGRLLEHDPLTLREIADDVDNAVFSITRDALGLMEQRKAALTEIADVLSADRTKSEKALTKLRADVTKQLCEAGLDPRKDPQIGGRNKAVAERQLASAVEQSSRVREAVVQHNGLRSEAVSVDSQLQQCPALERALLQDLRDAARALLGLPRAHRAATGPKAATRLIA